MCISVRYTECKFSQKPPFLHFHLHFLGLFSQKYLHKYTHTKSADLAIVYLQLEAFALPNSSNKQQETYADMTNRSAKNTAKQGILSHP